MKLISNTCNQSFYENVVRTGYHIMGQLLNLSYFYIYTRRW